MKPIGPLKTMFEIHMKGYKLLSALNPKLEILSICTFFFVTSILWADPFIHFKYI